jgi:hypothetical protein
MAQSSRAMLQKRGLLGEFTDLLASVKQMFDGYHPETALHARPWPGLARQARCGLKKWVACRAGLFLNRDIMTAVCPSSVLIGGFRQQFPA